VFLSSHYHLLLDLRDARHLSSFMRYLNSNVAREVGRLVVWSDGPTPALRPLETAPESPKRDFNLPTWCCLVGEDDDLYRITWNLYGRARPDRE
jgi:hypothetical protein